MLKSKPKLIFQFDTFFRSVNAIEKWACSVETYKLSLSNSFCVSTLFLHSFLRHSSMELVHTMASGLSQIQASYMFQGATLLIIRTNHTNHDEIVKTDDRDKCSANFTYYPSMNGSYYFEWSPKSYKKAKGICKRMGMFHSREKRKSLT